jgi:uncharacterized protein YciI
MTKRQGLFVKINYNNNGGSTDNRNNTNNISKSKDMNVKKYLLCAGVFNKNGGTMIFQAKNMDEAEQIVHNNPFVGSMVYNYEILKGDVISL